MEQYLHCFRDTPIHRSLIVGNSDMVEKSGAHYRWRALLAARRCMIHHQMKSESPNHWIIHFTSKLEHYKKSQCQKWESAVALGKYQRLRDRSSHKIFTSHFFACRCIKYQRPRLRDRSSPKLFTSHLIMKNLQTQL